MDHQSVYAYHILPGKSEEQKLAIKKRREKALDPEMHQLIIDYRKAMGWSSAKGWIQKLPGEELHILLFTSDKPLRSVDICERFRVRCDGGCPIAKEIRKDYIETQDMDFCDPSSYPSLAPLPYIESAFLAEELYKKSCSEYAFAYPLISSEREGLLQFLRETADSEEKRLLVKEFRKRSGIVEMQMWLQKSGEREMLLFYQKIVDPLSQSIERWHELVACEEFVKETASRFSAATGLTKEQLIPNLDSL